MKSSSGQLNTDEMAIDDNLDSYLLLPCRCEEKGAEDGSGCFDHSIFGWFEIENRPLRIDTVYFIGSRAKLKTHLKRKEGVDIGTAGKEFWDSFNGAGGLTFPCVRGDGTSLVVIWMPKFDWSVIDIETLSHECLHAAVMVMRMSGLKPKIFTADEETEVDDEGLCYRQATMLSSLIKKMVVKQNKMFKKAIGKAKGRRKSKAV